MITDQLIIKSDKEQSTYAKDNASESPKRSVVKSISWRIVGTLDTILISWVVTGTLSMAFSIGLVELVTKMVLYFFHERIWNSIKWGK
ncbi:Protein of unknown function DUF2061, membrane [Allomuricauda ruestringensis DSM 13258]|uniref:DUF2061 domain-containing protein n=1 Tax=Allomuricauda ruestringensis (strain DSM 13258 / CIP 107369 / LMG 19739 / B1) TaxID=886377 RepID=G2PKH7_ALLRU|nr:DUF2061 domain-containing protein [Allomuricauda ruestringensis]AEM70996.1 Protein of unknown function DUF2061, membrane [Allomuricauda ruestringensis DSM 13258]